MIPFNWFSLHDLIGFTATAPFVAIFCISYAKFGRKPVDLLLAMLLLCSATFCLALFMMDNIVRQGLPAAAVADGSAATLFWGRLALIGGIMALPLQVHFALCYVHSQSWIRRNILVLYGGAAGLAGLVLTDVLVRGRAMPLAATGSWRCASPFMPIYQPMFGLFVLLFAVAQVYTQVLLARWRGGHVPPGEASPDRLALVRVAFLLQAGGGLIDSSLSAYDYVGMAVFPITSLGAAYFLSKALISERMEAQRLQLRLQREMELAAEIQMGLLPESDPLMDGFDVHGWNKPASHAGGDSYDFIPLPHERLMIVLSDVSGHGVGPAILAAETRAIIRAVASTCSNPSKLLHQVDRLLSTDFAGGRFITCFAGLLLPRASRMIYASAGQGHVLWYRNAFGRVDELPSTVPPLGQALVGKPSRPDTVIELRSGDTILLTSDGFYEAQNAQGELFGIERVRQMLVHLRDCSLQDIIAGLLDSVRRFTGDLEQADDMTVVALRRTSRKPAELPIARPELATAGTS